MNPSIHPSIYSSIHPSNHPSIHPSTHLSMVLFHIQHHRVRYAACNSLGQLSSDFAPTLQDHFHNKIIPTLLIILDDFPNPRVQTHAGAALVNFCDHCSKRTLGIYLESIVSKLQNVLKIKLQEVYANIRT